MADRPTGIPNQTGRVIAVTGATAGIGYYLAEQLAAAGAHVVLLARSADRMEAAKAAIRGQVPGAQLSTIPLDLADLDSVSRAAAELNALGRLDVLVENAGLISPDKERRTTKQGLELTVGINHFGHFALTAQTMPALSASDAGRIVTVGSMLTRSGKPDLDDLQGEHDYAPNTAYAQSKHAVQLFGLELDRRLRANGSTVISVLAHPGGALDALSPVRMGVNEPSRVARFGSTFVAPIAHGKHRAARVLAHAATTPDAHGGEYYGPRFLIKGRPVLGSPPASSQDPALGERLWRMSEKFTGSSFVFADTPRP